MARPLRSLLECRDSDPGGDLLHSSHAGTSPPGGSVVRNSTNLDRAVLDAYGWSDIATDSEFLLDYEIDEEEWGDKKKPYRYRWPDEVRDEVLARLLELNAERAKEEARSGALVKSCGRKTGAKSSREESETGDVFL
jgi:hypothetical protein